MPEETELKLSLKPEQAGRIRNHPVVRQLKSGRARTKRLIGTYFDTPDFLLKRRQISLRVREVDHRYIQTLKQMRPSDGIIFRRDEWEKDILGRDPDLGGIDDVQIRRMFKKHNVAKTLMPLFQTDVQRTVWNLLEDDTEIELALDIGEIVGENGSRAPLCEAELELKAGDPSRLYDIALALNERIDCTVGTLAKSDHGYAMYGDEPLTAVKSSAVSLRRCRTVWQAFVAISRNCLSQLDANIAIARIGVDPEGVHQARVAIRRLRAAFKIFKAVLPDEKYQFFHSNLRWLQKELGAARDLDVFLIDHLDPILARLPKEPSLRDLRRRAGDARIKAYSRVGKALENRRYGRVRLELERWLAEPLQPDTDKQLTRNLRSFARRAIRKAHHKMLAAGTDLAETSEADLHTLRIHGKHARYCVEFFSGLFSGNGPRQHAKALAQLQDCLGVLNDSVVAEALLRRFERQAGGLDPRATAYVVGWFTARIHGERTVLNRRWAKLSKLEAYWI